MNFEGMTNNEITLDLLLIGFLTVAECIDKRIQLRQKILETINKN